MIDAPTDPRVRRPALPGRRPVRVAVCEAGPLTPHRDAGCRAVSDLIGALRDLGCEVFVGVESAGALPARLRGFAPDALIVSRPALFARLQPQLSFGTGPRVFFAHDLHHVRLGLQRAFDHSLDPHAPVVMRLVEEFCFRAADVAVLPSGAEARAAAEAFPGARVVSAPYFAMPAAARLECPGPPFRLVFVGGAAHAPNRDGVAWFIRDVWPGLRGRHAGIALSVCGAWPAALVAALAAPGVRFHGALSEDALGDVMRRSAIGIAPLRFGAGMKRKTLDYLARGLPVVSTTFGVEGLSAAAARTPGVILATSPAEWQEAVGRLITGAGLWDALSRAGHDFVGASFSVAVHRDGIRGILSSIGVSP